MSFLNCHLKHYRKREENGTATWPPYSGLVYKALFFYRQVALQQCLPCDLNSYLS